MENEGSLSTVKHEVKSLENLLGRGKRRVFSKFSQLNKDGVGKGLFASLLLVTDLSLHVSRHCRGNMN